MKYFSLPADFKKETIQEYQKINNQYPGSKIIETYGQITHGNVLNSGRVTEVLPKVNIKTLEEYVTFSSERGIGFNYTLNPACFGNLEFSEQGITQIFTLLEGLYRIGIRAITVSSPSLIELIQGTGLDFKLKASALCEITSPGKALFYKKMGLERIVVDPDVTRDFINLKNICHFLGEGVEIIVNNVCYRNCAYKMFHYNHESHCTQLNKEQTIKDYFFNRCSIQKAKAFENIIRLNWIRPEDLHYYKSSGISYFKIQGRQNVLQGDIIKAVKHYIEEDYDGNLFDLITIFAPYNAFQPYIDNKKLEGYISRFYEKPEQCQNLCETCQYCKIYAQKSINKEEAEELNRKALLFFKTYDKFSKIVQDQKGKKVKKLFEKKEFDLDFEL
jgi:collagenase-like PrtC family protease